MVDGVSDVDPALRAVLARLVRIVEDKRVQISVARVEHVGYRQGVARRDFVHDGHHIH